MSLAAWSTPETSGLRTPVLVPAGQRRVVRVRSPLHAAAVELLGRADEALLDACCAATAPERYVEAHLAALRAAAAVVAQRAGSGGGRGNVWGLLRRIAQELAEWTIFFAEVGHLRAQLLAGTAQVSTRQADDLVREAERFIVAVQRALDIHVVVDP